MKIIDEIISKTRKVSQEITVYLIVNKVGVTKPIDYTNTEHSIETEYLTLSEYDFIIKSLRINGFVVKIYYDAINFISYAVNNIQTLKDEKAVIFNLGRNGKGLNKKTLIPSFCEKNGLNYTGSDAYVSSLGRHKYHLNSILKAHNLCFTESWLYTKRGWLHNSKPEVGLKVIVKPTYESASRGITQDSIFNYDVSMDEFINSLQIEYEQDIIVQEFIPGYELEVPILHTDTYEILTPVGISMYSTKELGDNIITYDIAFDETYTFFDFDDYPKLNEVIVEDAKKVAECINLGNYSRIDYRINSVTNKCHVIDVSTHPFVIQHSSFIYSFKKLGYSEGDLFCYIIGSAIRNL